MKIRNDVVVVALIALSLGAGAAWWLGARSAPSSDGTLSTAIAQILRLDRRLAQERDRDCR
jgi:uncharacterized membrane protein YfbV (UPF0208 family)